jgi:aspartyl-tRNA(Asn)/glutamyl-tRNA(Gln) amidotransferase subunit B
MTGNEANALLLVTAGLELDTAATVSMNQLTGRTLLPENAAPLVEVIRAGNLTREALNAAFEAATARAIDAAEFLGQTAVSDEAALGPVIDAVLAANPQQVETYRGGKEGVLGFLVGQVMRETQGKADPAVVNRLLREKLRT